MAPPPTTQRLPDEPICHIISSILHEEFLQRNQVLATQDIEPEDLAPLYDSFFRLALSYGAISNSVNATVKEDIIFFTQNFAEGLLYAEVARGQIWDETPKVDVGNGQHLIAEEKVGEFEVMREICEASTKVAFRFKDVIDKLDRMGRIMGHEGPCVTTNTTSTKSKRV